jgi:hypothetical protein
MYIRVKRKKLTVFLQVEPTDTILEVKEKLQQLIEQVSAVHERHDARQLCPSHTPQPCTHPEDAQSMGAPEAREPGTQHAWN